MSFNPKFAIGDAVRVDDTSFKVKGVNYYIDEPTGKTVQEYVLWAYGPGTKRVTDESLIVLDEPWRKVADGSVITEEFATKEFFLSLPVGTLISAGTHQFTFFKVSNHEFAQTDSDNLSSKAKDYMEYEDRHFIASQMAEMVFNHLKIINGQRFKIVFVPEG